mmetsp:Transcript_13815/g.40674  ORF Transcript_13815/g.40674 Transcript_13815/m.40674 type:complete len:384 (-) Transcript_13815:734-1885(-)
MPREPVARESVLHVHVLPDVVAHARLAAHEGEGVQEDGQEHVDQHQRREHKVGPVEDVPHARRRLHDGLEGDGVVKDDEAQHRVDREAVRGEVDHLVAQQVVPHEGEEADDEGEDDEEVRQRRVGPQQRGRDEAELLVEGEVLEEPHGEQHDHHRLDHRVGLEEVLHRVQALEQRQEAVPDADLVVVLGELVRLEVEHAELGAVHRHFGPEHHVGDREGVGHQVEQHPAVQGPAARGVPHGLHHVVAQHEHVDHLDGDAREVLPVVVLVANWRGHGAEPHVRAAAQRPRHGDARHGEELVVPVVGAKLNEDVAHRRVDPAELARLLHLAQRLVHGQLEEAEVERHQVPIQLRVVLLPEALGLALDEVGRVVRARVVAVGVEVA